MTPLGSKSHDDCGSQYFRRSSRAQPDALHHLGTQREAPKFFRSYAGVIRELEDTPRKPAAEAIREAREQVRRATGVRTAEGASP